MSASFTPDPAPTRLTLVFTGRLDSAHCAGLHDAVLEQVSAVTPQQALRFDLAGSDFVASAFLRLCILAAHAVGAERFEIAHPAPLVREVFAMAGLDRHLTIIDAAAP
jgi:anti-anti-sigma regulatory factor